MELVSEERSDRADLGKRNKNLGVVRCKSTYLGSGAGCWKGRARAFPSLSAAGISGSICHSSEGRAPFFTVTQFEARTICAPLPESPAIIINHVFAALDGDKMRLLVDSEFGK